jgi:hypothetical protein
VVEDSGSWLGNGSQLMLTRCQIKIDNKWATIAPLILASDKTSLSVLSGGQEAYPVYLTLGNISKSIRRKASENATILVGYLPVEKFEDVASDTERAQLKANLLHRAMAAIMDPLKQAGSEGVPMWCADGRERLVYPIVAAFVGDWPEQNVMACTNQGGCPVCKTPHVGRGDYDQRAPLRAREETLEALRSYYRYDRHLGELDELKLKPWWPWWGDIPELNFHSCIAPDLLHQLHQGLFKSHILTWTYGMMGAEAADERFTSMSRAEGMRHFTRRVSKIKNWTGRESKELAKQILPVVVGKLGDDAVELVRSLLDFMYQAHAASMSDDDLEELEHSLATFHRLKDVVVRTKVFQGTWRFDDIPKLHMMSHYLHSIRELGTPDGYNTESPEHLHIFLAKKGYRASNKVRPLPQMAKYVQRLEAIRMLHAYIEDYYGPCFGQGAVAEDKVLCGLFEAFDESGEGTGDGEGDEEWLAADNALDRGDGGVDEAEGEGEGEGEVDAEEGELEIQAREDEQDASSEVHYPTPDLAIAKQPTRARVEGTEIMEQYGAVDLIPALEDCLASRYNVPRDNILLSSRHSFPVWHRFALHHRPLPFALGEPPKRDVIRARPPTRNAARYLQRQGEFDTAIFLDKPDKFGLERMYLILTYMHY